MRWRKLGVLFCPDGHQPWMHSHAALPVPVELEPSLIRVFFSSRDMQNRSIVAYVDMELGESPRVVDVARTPVLCTAPAGAFDDSGVGLGCVVPAEGRDRLYYMGWNLGVLAPWRNSIGLAGGSARQPHFERMSAGPIMDRSPIDPYTLSYPWVLHADGQWHMWYGSNLSWGREIADMTHIIRHATSSDGIEWRREQAVAINVDDNGTYALARPCVLRDRDVYRMWYAYRGAAYRIGYAESGDGRLWTRRDADAGISPSESGWDSEMICYPCVFDHGGQRLLLYNGNGYGRTGFGLAVLEQP